MNWYIGRFKNSRIVYGLKALLSLIMLLILIVVVFNQNILDFELVVLFFVQNTAVDILFLLLLFKDSYIVKNDELIFFKSFHKKTLRVSEVSIILVINNLFPGRGLYSRYVRNKDGKNVCIPYLIIIDEKIDGISGLSVDYPLPNYFLPHVFRDRGIDVSEMYGFLYNNKAIEILLKSYNGKVFIARTVYENYKEEIANIYSKWEYKDKSISIIQDHNARGSFCNSPYLTLE